MSAKASRDFPAPEGPRISAARAPRRTAEAWMVEEVTPVLRFRSSPTLRHAQCELRKTKEHWQLCDSGEALNLKLLNELPATAAGTSTSPHYIAGRRTTKRAPSTCGPSGPSETPMRFSARMRPPCASMIWREIERPRPEFWPKP